MISIFTDPGKTGGISAVDENEQILFSVGLVDGLPPEGFMIVRHGQEGWHHFTFAFGLDEPMFPVDDCHFGIEIADLKNLEFGDKKASGKTVIAKSMGRLFINTGLIIQWFTERGVHDMIEFKPREWQTIYKGFGGKDSKEKAFKCLRERYCQRKGRAKLLSYCGPTCSYFKSECPLKKHGIIGPRGGYRDGQGDSVCGALHLMKTTIRQRKVRK